MAEQQLTAVFTADIGSFTSSMDSVKKSLKDTGDTIDKSLDGAQKSTSKATSSISSTLKGLGGIIAGAFAIDAIKNFGVSIVQEAASLQALNSQFEQVFGSLQGEASKAVDALAKEFGMVSSRITPSLTQMTSMFKGLGLETEEAMETATRGVTMAADAAAFYDISYSDANSALNSFIKGNYEGGERIGLFANETQMAAFAANDLGVEWKSLDEAGKQLIRLQYAEKMQEAAGATGQAARESDGLENVMGNLTASWDHFKAILGGAFLPMAISGIQQLSGFIQGINVEGIAQGFMAFGEWMGSIFSPIIEAVKNSFTTIFSGLNIENLTGQFDVITGLFDVMGEDIAILSEVLAGFIEEFGVFVADIVAFLMENLKPKFDEAFKIISEVVEETFIFLEHIWNEILQPVFETIMEVIERDLAPAFETNFKTMANVVETVFKTITTLWNTVLLPIFKVIIDVLKVTLLPAFQTIFSTIGTVVSTTFSAISGFWNNTLKPVLTGITDFLSGVFTGNWEKAWNGVVSIFSGIFSGIETAVKAPLNAVIGMINAVIGGMNSLSISIPDWVPGFGGQKWGINIPKIPQLETGGIVTGSTLAQIGENGDEAIIPLSNKSKMLPWAREIASMLNTTNTNSSSSGGETYYITFGDVHGATQKQAEDFATKFINTVKRGKGGIK